MNHIYRTVWNEITRSFVAVAETVKSHGKRASSKSCTASAESVVGAAPARRGLVTSRLNLMRLEPRLVFDGAAVDTVVTIDAQVQEQPAPSADTRVAADTLPVIAPPTTTTDTREAASAIQDSATYTAQLLTEGDPAPRNGRIEIAFVEDNVVDWQSLASRTPAGIEVVKLDSRGDGLTQIAAYLANRNEVDAIHILSHGSDGQINLGALTLNRGNLDAQANTLARIGQALTETGDLLLYGCNVGAGETAEEFIHSIARITQADVAASNDPTGSAEQGGNWSLEFHAGQIESDESIAHVLYPDYGYLLESVPFTGSVTTTTSFHRPWTPADIDGSNGFELVYTGDQIAQVSPDTYNYTAASFTPDATGLYSLEVSQANFPGNETNPEDSFLAIYEGAFDPTRPLQNLKWANDDSTIDYKSSIPNVTLTAGTKYILVMTTYTAGATGSYTFTSTGVGGGSFSEVVPPTLTTMTTLTGAQEDTALPISFGDLVTAGNENDTDGSVSAFVVKSVSSGTLLIGGEAWIAGTNDVIDNAHSATWTPSANKNGTAVAAFTVTAADDDGNFSDTAVQVTVNVAAVNDAPAPQKGTGAWMREWTINGGSQDSRSSAVLVQKDGKVVMGGVDYTHVSYGGYLEPNTIVQTVARFDNAGTLDSSFGTDGRYTLDALGDFQGTPVAKFEAVTALAELPDGKILIGAIQEVPNPIYTPATTKGQHMWQAAIYRLNADGSHDDGFAQIALEDLQVPGRVVVLDDGDFLVTGTSAGAVGTDQLVIYRFNANGSPETTFGTNGIVRLALPDNTSAYAWSAELQGNTLVLSAREGGGSGVLIGKINANTGATETWGTGGFVLNTDLSTANLDQFRKLLINPDGSMFAVGDHQDGTQYKLFKLDGNGTVDTAWGTDGAVTLTETYDIGWSSGSALQYLSVAMLQPDGKVVMAGSARDGTSFMTMVMRVNPDGTLDTTFNGTGKLLFDQNPSQLVRVGTNWDTGEPIMGSTYDQVADIGLLPDGSIALVGSATRVLNGQSTNLDSQTLVRISPDGVLDPTFGDPDGSASNSISITEGDAPVALYPGATIFDIDLYQAGNYNGATLSLSRHGGADTDDQFSALAGSNLVMSGASGNLVLSGTTIGSFTNGNGTLAITFNANATQARLGEALRSIAYKNGSKAPEASVAIDWLFNDKNTGAQGIGPEDGTTITTTVNIAPVNDAPTLDLNGATEGNTNSATFTGAALGFTTGSGVITDVDSTSLARLTVRVASNSLEAGDTLVVDLTNDVSIDLTDTTATGEVTVGGVVFAYRVSDDDANRVVTFESLESAAGDPIPATKTAYTSLLNALKYSSSGNPTAETTRVFSVVLTDSTAMEGPFNTSDGFVLLDESDPFGGDYLQAESMPALVDVDGDGDFDVVLGIYNYDDGVAPSSQLKVLINNPVDGKPVFTEDSNHSLAQINLSANLGDERVLNTSVQLIDYDGDGDLDLLLGGNRTSGLVSDTSTGYYGGTYTSWDWYDAPNLQLFEKTADGYVEKTGENNPLAGVLASIAEIQYAEDVTAVLGDVDGDGDLDLIVGFSSYDGPQLKLFVNSTTDKDSIPLAFGSGNDIALPIEIGRTAAPALADFDGDDDLDIVLQTYMQEDNSYYWSYQMKVLDNDGSGQFTLLDGANNPLADFALTDQVDVTFADIDGDGDLDAVAKNDGYLSFLDGRQGVKFDFTVTIGTVEHDTDAPAAPSVALSTDTGSSDSDKITKDGALTVSGVEEGATVEYSTDNGDTWSESFDAVAGENTVKVRQTDAAGNVSAASTAFTFTLDTAVPSAPTIALTTDTGSSATDKITNNGALTVSGTETGATVEYSTNGTSGWSTTAPTATAGSNTVYVRQTDAAGNVSAASTAFAFTLDSTAPTLSSSVPEDGTTSVVKGSNIELTFSENVTAVASKNIVIRKASDNTAVATIAATDTTQVSISGGVVTINPTADLDYGTAYYMYMDAGAFKDAAGNEHAGIANATSLNFTTEAAPVDVSPPAFVSAAVNGTALVLTYNEALDATNIPPASAFTVKVNDVAVTLAATNPVVVNATAKTVTLNLAKPVAFGKTLTVSYADPSAANDANAIQDTAGNDAAALVNQSVANNSAATTSVTMNSVVQPSRSVTISVPNGLSVNDATSEASPSGLPKNVKLPLGQFGFEITGVSVGGTANLSMTLDANLKSLSYFKLNHVTGKWDNIATGSSIDTATGKATVNFSLTDGGAYDADRTANGVIVDPGGAGENSLLPYVFENTVDVGSVVLVNTDRVNGTISYALTGGEDQAKFRVNAATGALEFISAPNFEAPTDAGEGAGNNTYALQVTIRGSNGGSEVQNLVVTVLNVLENGENAGVTQLGAITATAPVVTDAAPVQPYVPPPVPPAPPAAPPAPPLPVIVPVVTAPEPPPIAVPVALSQPVDTTPPLVPVVTAPPPPAAPVAVSPSVPTAPPPSPATGPAPITSRPTEVLTAPAANAFQVVVAARSPGGGDALLVNTPMRDAVVAAGERIAVTIPTETFAHTRADAVVSLVATRADGAALPGWLSFNPRTGTFEGTPPPGFVGEVAVRVVARDNDGRQVVQTFKIAVGVGQGRVAPAEGRGEGQPDGQPNQRGQGAPGRTGSVIDKLGKPSLAKQFDRHGPAARHAETNELIVAARKAVQALSLSGRA